MGSFPPSEADNGDVVSAAPTSYDPLKAGPKQEEPEEVPQMSKLERLKLSQKRWEEENRRHHPDSNDEVREAVAPEVVNGDHEKGSLGKEVNGTSTGVDVNRTGAGGGGGGGAQPTRRGVYTETSDGVRKASLQLPPANETREADNTYDQAERRESLAPIANFKGSFLGTSRGSLSGPSRRKIHWTEHFTTGWNDVQIYKAGIIECVATTLLVYVSGLIDVTIVNMQTRYLPVFAAVSTIFLLTLFIMAAGPGSGGHMNPTVTFATMCVGLTGVPRGVVYMLAQLLGASIAGGALRGVLGASAAIKQNGGGCFIAGSAVDSGQALLNESLSTLALLFIAFGVGLDPRQAKLFGAIIGPLAVGSGLALIIFGNAGVVAGYTGASMNPARCFAFAVARGGFGDEWIWWVGPIIGSIVHAGVYIVAPPYDERPVRASDSFV